MKVPYAGRGTPLVPDLDKSYAIRQSLDWLSIVVGQYGDRVSGIAQAACDEGLLDFRAAGEFMRGVAAGKYWPNVRRYQTN